MSDKWPSTRLKHGWVYTREQAEDIARSTPIPAFKCGERYHRRQYDYTVLCSKLLRRKVDKYAVRKGKVRMARVRAGDAIMVKLCGPYGEIYETEAALFFNDPRWPARLIGMDPEAAARAKARLVALTKARAARTFKQKGETDESEE